ncbi:hypothetical protein Hanom_Chr17g01545781 [Helianthus anomalus]
MEKKTILYASIWKIWKTRNNCVFNSISFSVLKVVDGIKRTRLCGLNTKRLLVI